VCQHLCCPSSPRWDWARELRGQNLTGRHAGEASGPDSCIHRAVCGGHQHRLGPHLRCAGAAVVLWVLVQCEAALHLLP
jgi:hypothetical protein